MLLNFLAVWGSYIWMFASFFVMGESVLMYTKSHKIYHLANSITWLCAGLYGMTYPAINVQWIAYLNVSLFWIGAVTNVYAHTARTKELFMKNTD